MLQSTKAVLSADENNNTSTSPSIGGGKSGSVRSYDDKLSEEQDLGHVASNPRPRRSRAGRGPRALSSWAFNDVPTIGMATTAPPRRRSIIIPTLPSDETRSDRSAPPPPRSDTPTVNNLTGGTAYSYYTPVKGDGGSRTGPTSDKRNTSRRRMGAGGASSSSGIKSETMMKGYSSDDTSTPPVGTTEPRTSGQEEQTTSNSFKGWLTAGILDALNVAAGLTLSTTGTIMAPSIALTRNVLIPGILALVVDTLDHITPPLVQNWIRIVTSSIYNFYTVLSQTDQGRIFRQQLLLVIKVLLEAWSSPESRQVVVDGMAAGVKLADALHTPEMLVFLEQASVLGCRVVDALASGRSKQLIQNSKELIWKGIELAVDPSTTAALAEVTAHLCQALDEMDRDLSAPRPTARAVRNAQNYATYLQTLQITEYRGDRIEDVILSSLGTTNDDGTANTDTSNYNSVSDDEDDGVHGGTYYNSDDADDEGIAVASVPSNVAFPEEATHGSNRIERQVNLGPTNTTRKGVERRVNVELLKDQLSLQGRPQARLKKLSTNSEAGFGSHAGISGNSKLDYSAFTPGNESFHGGKKTINGADPAVTVDPDGISSSSQFLALEAKDMEEVSLPGKMEIGITDPENTIPTRPNIHELYGTMKRMQRIEEKEPSTIQFYRVIDDLLEQSRKERERLIANETQPSNPQDPAAQSEWKRSHATVRRFRDGSVIMSSKGSVRGHTNEYANLRRLWKYPPSLLRLSSIILGITVLFWVAFGLYGMYTFVNVVYIHSASGGSLLSLIQPTHPWMAGNGRSTIPQSTPNEIVIRIVKEVIHVREDGTRIDDSEINHVDDGTSSFFSQVEKERVMECIASTAN